MESLDGARQDNPQASMPSVEVQGSDAPRDVDVTPKDMEMQLKKATENTELQQRARESFRATNINLKQIKKNHLKKVKNFELKRKCERLCYINNTLWCPCYNGDIDIYNTDGQLLHTLHTDLIQEPQSVHPLTDQHVLVAAENGLYKMTTEGKEVSQVIGGRFKDVHANKNIVAALEYVQGGKDKVHILDNTDLLSGHRHFSLDNDLSTSLLVVGEHIYVSFYDENTLTSHIIQYTVDGEKLGQYGQYGHFGESGPGELDNFDLCVSDTQQSVLVADINNHRLQILDRQGQWKVIRPKELRWLHPYDVIITPERDVYILCDSFTSCKIQKYKLKWT